MQPGLSNEFNISDHIPKWNIFTSIFCVFLILLNIASITFTFIICVMLEKYIILPITELVLYVLVHVAISVFVIFFSSCPKCFTLNENNISNSKFCTELLRNILLAFNLLSFIISISVMLGLYMLLCNTKTWIIITLCTLYPMSIILTIIITIFIVLTKQGLPILYFVDKDIENVSNICKKLFRSVIVPFYYSLALITILSIGISFMCSLNDVSKFLIMLLLFLVCNYSTVIFFVIGVFLIFAVVFSILDNNVIGLKELTYWTYIIIQIPMCFVLLVLSLIFAQILEFNTITGVILVILNLIYYFVLTTMLGINIFIAKDPQ